MIHDVDGREIVRVIPVMNQPFLLYVIIGAVVGASCGQVRALETDQFTVPPKPLVNLGPELLAEVRRAIELAIDQANTREETDERFIAAQIHRLLGRGLIETGIEHWMRKTDFGREPASLVLPASQTIYAAAAKRQRLAFLRISPTVNLYGVYLGTDKLGHFFQHGYDYYRVFMERTRRGHGEDEATQAAVARGVREERGTFGLALTGVYSNADLAANYAGMKFYLNLTRPVQLGRWTSPQILVRNRNRWRFNHDASDQILAPFITEHFNEAMNGCRYKQEYGSPTRALIRKRGPSWAKFHRTNFMTEVARADSLLTWYGETYGHSGFDGVVTAAEFFFDRGSVRGTRGGAVIKARTALGATAEPPRDRAFQVVATLGTFESLPPQQLFAPVSLPHIQQHDAWSERPEQHRAGEYKSRIGSPAAVALALPCRPDVHGHSNKD